MTPTTPEPASRAAETFTAHFGRPPAALAFAPGRVNLIGDHTDYAEGFVCPAALAVGCGCAIAPAEGPRHRFVAADLGETAEVPTLGLTPEAVAGSPRFARYVAGVIAEWHATHPEVPFRAYAIALRSSVPVGSGLSSSAALEVSVATALDALHGVTTPPTRLALLCQRAEHRFAGMPCGIMDQLISCTGVVGHAVMIDCRSLETTPVPVPMRAGVGMAASVGMVLFDTGVSHANTDNAYARRRAACERASAALGVRALRDADAPMLTRHAASLDEEARLAAEHVVGENARVLAFVESLRARDLRRAGWLMTESHRSLSQTYRVSCHEADALVEGLLAAPGVLGARMTGAGFGGWVLALLETGSAGVADAASDLHDRVGGRPGCSRPIVVEPAGAARAVR